MLTLLLNKIESFVDIYNTMGEKVVKANVDACGQGRRGIKFC